MIENIGADVYKSWSEEQRKAEIGKLVDGYRRKMRRPEE